MKDTQVILSQDKLVALFKISQQINQMRKVGELLDEILYHAITTLSAERGLIILTDPSHRHYRTIASESMNDEELAFSTSIVDSTIASGKTRINPDVQSSSEFRESESVKGLNILSYICTPLFIPGSEKMLGTLYIDQRVYEKTFTREDGAFLEAFANLASIAIHNADMMERLRNENLGLRQEVARKYEFPGVIGKSRAMQDIFRDMHPILNDTCTVLITGETGTGKEVVAKAIHHNGKRKNKPFLAINCGAFPETLLEVELFGSTRGAYTGAIDKKGLFQAAEGGTLFLDEIHHTAEAMQVKLLRVLQEREIRRIGGTKNISVEARVICATNEDLQERIRQGNFRRDFYYRINIVTIDVPPLRRRKEDIELLAHHFLNKFSETKGKRLKGFDPAALAALKNHHWKENNVRELENEIERLVIFAENRNTVRLEDLSEKVRAGESDAGRPGVDLFAPDDRGILPFREMEKSYIHFILSYTEGNKAEAARLMEIPRSTLRGKMRKLGMKA